MNQRTQKPIDWSQVPEFRSNDPKLYELDPVLLDDDPDALMPDYMSRLGTSSAEASKASKDLSDLEIVIPGPEASASAANLLSGLGPARPGYMDISEPPGRFDPDIDQALRDLFREPWYKRLWSWLATPDHSPLTDHDLHEIAESLDLVLRLPLYKRIPSLILWLWRLP